MPKKQVPKGAKMINRTGPFSAVIQVGDFYFFSGVLPNIEEGRAVSPDLAAQAREVLKKILGNLAFCELTYNDLIQVDVIFNYNLDQARLIFDPIYAGALGEVEILPVRKAWGGGLACSALIEIQVVAVRQTEE